jgi:pimeloyl-ACP methyl ester carboxylesterase
MTSWVLLRGLTRESRHWGAFARSLASELGGPPVIALDLPGNGALHAERSPACVEALAEACRAELARRRIAPPYRVLAMSLGAMVAVAWAARHPRELSAAVLVNTSLRPFSPLHHRLRPASWPVLLRLALADPAPGARERAVLGLTSRLAAAPDELLRDWTAWREQCPVSRANALRQVLAAARFVAPRAGPAVPMLLLASTQDGLVDVRCSRRLAEAWRAPLVEHPGAGHDLPLDDGPWVAGQVRRWIAG